jgi:hypothetical protein
MTKRKEIENKTIKEYLKSRNCLNIMDLIFYQAPRIVSIDKLQRQLNKEIKIINSDEHYVLFEVKIK